MLHINQVGTKIPSVIIYNATEFVADSYHTNIIRAANTLYSVPTGDYLHYIYQTQYFSGATLWKSAYDERTIIVHADGKIDLTV